MNFFRKKYYREVPCKACDGKGKLFTNSYPNPYNENETIKDFHVCGACRGRGTQTVLQRVE